jgi:zinc/manganese transport system permease protein
MIFQYLNHEFVQNAILVGTIVAILTPIMGYFVVLRAQAFASDSFSHISMVGMTGSVLLGIPALLGTFLLTILSALGIGAFGERVRERHIETGMVLSLALGLGVLFISIQTSSPTANGTADVLFGSILSVTRSEVIITLISGIVVLLALAALFRPLLFASFDPTVAETRGVPLRFISLAFLVLLAIAVSIAAEAVGVLLVFALLIAPAASAEYITHRPLTAIVLSAVLGLLYIWLSLFLAFTPLWGHDLPISFYITALATLSFFIAMAIGKLRKSRHIVLVAQDTSRETHRHQDEHGAFAGH